MIVILMVAIISSNENYLTMPSHADHCYYWFYENDKQYFPYINLHNIIQPQKNPLSRASTAFPLLADSILQTIWLPISTGGVILSNKLVYNSINDLMYVNGDRNIAVCDGQSGELLSVISTCRTRRKLAYNEIGNKLYCANCLERTLDVIDCQNHQVIKTIPLTDTATALVWNDFNNEIYYTQHPPQQADCRIEVIDCTSDSIITSIPTGGYPKNLFYNPLSNKIYCANWGILDIIDGNSHNVIKQIPLDPSLHHFFTLNTINNKIYCINLYNDNVAIIDGVGDSLITTVPLGSEPQCVAYNSAANCIYVGHIPSKDVYILDGNTNQIIGYLYFAAPVTAMTYDSTDNRLFVVTFPYQAEDNYAEMIVLDGTSNAIIDTLKTGILPWNSIIWEREYNQVWVGNRGFNNFPGYTIDGYSADSLEHEFKTVIGFTPYAAVLNPATHKYYCVGRSDNYIVIFDISNPDTCVLKETGECVWDILLNPLENKIYCANNTGRDVAIIDGATDSIIARVPIGADAKALAFNQTDNKVYVSSSLYPLSGYVTVIDGHTNAVLDTISVAWHPNTMLWNSIDNKLYVSSYQESTITILDAHADTILTTISSNGFPWSLVHNSTDDKIYCSNEVSKEIMVIDGVTNEVIKIISGYFFSFTFAYNPVNNKVYCGNTNSSIAVIDGATDSTVSTIAIPGRPYSLLYNPITNTIFCAYIYYGQDALIVIDGASNEILANFTIDSTVRTYGTWGGISSPRKALLLDSLNNHVYLNHYSSSKISVIDGAIGISERIVTSLRSTFLHVFPNPTARYVNVEFLLPGIYDVQMMIYDVTGRKVECFKFPNKKSHRFIWDGTDRLGKGVPSGVYFITLKAGDHREIVKLLFLK